MAPSSTGWEVSRTSATSGYAAASSRPSARVNGDTAEREIDATGLLVTPGFVDLHTHYDGQSIWSERLTPSSAHGVTTVVMGNCGVGFAPCRQEDHDVLVDVMAGVEDIPGVVMTDGLPWTLGNLPRIPGRAWKRASATSTWPPIFRIRRCGST